MQRHFKVKRSIYVLSALYIVLLLSAGCGDKAAAGSAETARSEAVKDAAVVMEPENAGDTVSSEAGTAGNETAGTNITGSAAAGAEAAGTDSTGSAAAVTDHSAEEQKESEDAAPDTEPALKPGMIFNTQKNELGQLVGGQPGDQTGREFLIRPYRNFPWDTVLRYNEDAAVSPSGVPKVLRKGDTGEDVKEMQTLLIDAGYSIGPDGADGDFGSNTLSALLKFQAGHDLIVDGEYGDQSREALTKAAKTASPAPLEWVGYVTAKSGLNIRSSAEKTSDNILYAIVFGSKVTVFGKSGGWLHVHVSGRSDGWCSSEFISNGK